MKPQLLREGVEALIQRLGPDGAAQFIAAMGGEGDSVQEIRRMREGVTLEELVKRIRAKKTKAGRKRGGSAISP
ncbi:MAG: hypothetical protein HY558_05950 [Euryarchaeota archaeon]|nr:hypothetical protein [Euryarchaeota archaeon]